MIRTSKMCAHFFCPFPKCLKFLGQLLLNWRAMEIIQRLVIFITLQRIILALELRTIYQISNKLHIKQPCIISNNKSELQIVKYFCHYNSYITPSCPNGVFEKDEIEFNMMNTIILTIPVGISEKGWVIACSGRWYTDLVFLIQSNI